VLHRNSYAYLLYQYGFELLQMSYPSDWQRRDNPSNRLQLIARNNNARGGHPHLCGKGSVPDRIGTGEILGVFRERGKACDRNEK